MSSDERRAVPKPLDAGTTGAGYGAPAEAGPEPRGPSGAGASPRDGGASVGRRRLSLRIPDDEITRPKLPLVDPASRPELPPTTPVPPEAAPPEPQSMGVVTPMRIINVSSLVPTLPEPPERAFYPPDPPTDPMLVRDDGWTPAAVDVTFDAPPVPSADLPLGSDEVEIRFDETTPPPERHDPIPIAAPFADGAASAFAPTAPPTNQPGDMPAGAPPAPSAVESAPPERRSDPSDAHEIAAEDLVAVEPMPSRPAASLPPLPPVAPSQPPARRPMARTVALADRPPLVIVPPHVGNVAPASGESPTASGRRKGRLWWEDLFNDDYVRASERVTDEQIAREVTFMEESLGVERGGALLDLACGTGQHAVALSRRGYEVVGFDLSLAMLARAGEEAQERETKINFIQGDMREMTFDEQFDGVYCWNTSFGYFEEDKNAQVVDRVHRSLRVGGSFLLDVINRDFLVRQSPSLAWFEGDGCVCMDEMSVDFITSRMRVKRTMMLDDGRSREVEYSIRVYSLHELGKILHEHGFKVREVSGRLATPGVFFGTESPRAIILAEKR